MTTHPTTHSTSSLDRRAGGGRRPRPTTFTVIAVVAAVAVAAALALAACTGASSASPVSANPTRSCTSLRTLGLTDGAVTHAATVTTTKTTPAYCDVQVTITNTPAQDAVHVGVFLPVTAWNGNFIGTGGGGFVGGVPSTPCTFVPGVPGEPCALSAHYATADTDAGHTNPTQLGDDTDGSWALDPDSTLDWQRVDDFGFLGIHEMTTSAKFIIAAYYGNNPRYSFFTGGSNGGHQALAEAQRYPTDYNGIAAASPAINWTKFIAAWMWGELQMTWSNDEIPQAKFTALNEAAIAACDGLDGVKDGIISDWQHCHYDARTAVGTETSAGPITTTDATIVDKIWEGPRGPTGEFLWYGYERGADFADFAGTTTVNGITSGVAPVLSDQWYRYWLTQNPGFDWHTVTYVQFVQLFRQSVSEFGYAIATDDPDLTAFRDAGGKVVFWHGTYDPEIPTMGSVDYWNRLTRTMGGTARTEEFARLFIAPGAGHVQSAAGPAPANAQGSAPSNGSALGAVVNWVEHGNAPTQLLGVSNPIAKPFNTDGSVTMTRPVCLYPLVAKYEGHGSTNTATNFKCSAHF